MTHTDTNLRTVATALQASGSVADEMERARLVQDRLLRHHGPVMRTLSYDGQSVSAREVGGDFFDFLGTGPGKLGLALGDISGKGLSAALMMASLQASLRSLIAADAGDLAAVLASVNRLFTASTAAPHYATLFLGEWDDAGSRLRYVNCGHVTPHLLRIDGSIERLDSTATVLGLFEDWHCDTRQVQLAPGDTLVVMSDGVTEAMDDGGREFGTGPLASTLARLRGLPVDTMVSGLLDASRRFAGGATDDDMTVVVARCMPRQAHRRLLDAPRAGEGLAA